ncbi:MAG: hypothetical protein GF398_08835 [Chitinivibrionales bacterium]|nr:hypothetical protein [Chitinivibrionales bacterium]
MYHSLKKLVTMVKYWAFPLALLLCMCDEPTVLTSHICEEKFDSVLVMGRYALDAIEIAHSDQPGIHGILGPVADILLYPTDSNYVAEHAEKSTKTDVNGKWSALVAPGKYEIWGVFYDMENAKIYSDSIHLSVYGCDESQTVHEIVPRKSL